MTGVLLQLGLPRPAPQMRGKDSVSICDTYDGLNPNCVGLKPAPWLAVGSSNCVTLNRTFTTLVGLQTQTWSSPSPRLIRVPVEPVDTLLKSSPRISSS